LTMVCRTLPVQENFTRWLPVTWSPNTHLSFLNLLNLPK
jgi:hypothetical protein